MATRMTYTAIQAQIKKLTKEAEAVRAKEVAGVIERIKAAVDAYGLTAEDLGFAGNASRGASVARPAKPSKPAVKAKSQRVSVIRFRDDQGNSWTGFGPKPRWYKEALAGGASLESLTAEPAT